MKKILILFSFVALTWLSACSPFSGDPDISFHEDNILMPKIRFSVGAGMQSWVEFWPDSKPGLIRSTPPDSAQDQEVLLMNLTQETRYRFRLLALKHGTTDTLRSRVFDFMTGTIPGKVFSVRKDAVDTTAFSGYILLRRFYVSGADALVNNKGEIVWYHLYDTAIRRPISYTSQGTFLSIYDSAVIRETDISGKTLLDIDMEKLGQPERFHHEVIYDGEGNILSLSVDSAKRDLRRFGGKKDQFLRADGIVKMNKQGKILWKWSLLDDHDPNQFPDSVNIRDIWGHANAMVLDKDGNYLVSFRDFSQVWKIDATSGKVIWKLGKGGDFKMPKEAWFIRQHTISWTKDGDLIMFDNGERRVRPNSRVVVLRLDQGKKEASIVNLITLPLGYSSYRMGSAQKLNDTDFLVCVTRKNATLLIVDKDGNIKWKAVADHASYRAEMILNPFRF